MAITNRTVHPLDERGTIRDWLVTPAWIEQADDLGDILDATGTPWDQPGKPGRWVLTNGPDVSPLKERLFAARPLAGEPPAGKVMEGAAVTYTGPRGEVHNGTWQRVHTGDDGLVDWSEFCFTPEYRLAAAATVIEVDQADRRMLAIASTGPWQAYLNGELIGSSDVVTYMEPHESYLDVFLPSRTSTLMIVLWQVAFREVRHIVRVRVEGLPVRVCVPAEGADEDQSMVAERLLNAVGITQWGSVDGRVILRGPAGLRIRAEIPGRSRVITLEPGETTVDFEEGQTGEDESELSSGGAGASMLARPYDEVVVTIDHEDPQRVPVSRALPFVRLPERYRGEPEGTPEQWRKEFFEHALTIGGTGGELCRLALDPGAEIDPTELDKALWMINNRADCADFEVVGLMHLLHRLPAERWPAGLRETVVNSLLSFKFWIDEPGLDAMCYFTENHQLVWHTAETLVGEYFADETFSNNGMTGEEHAAHGRELAKLWIERKLSGGFAEFDSNAYLAIDTLALVSLAEFCADEALATAAAALADRVILSLASNTWRGIHGAAHGRSYVPTLRSSRLEETAPISWVCFGVGALNAAVLPTTVIATAQKYQVPTVAAKIATAQPERYWAAQHYEGTYRFHHDLLERPYVSDVRIFHTPHVMLASVQDYRSYLPGLQEHIWNATLGPETQIFATHAPNSSVSPSARPNTWAGNRVLPRVRQHEDSLIALYRIGENDPMGYTHLWWPHGHLDEEVLGGEWACARRGDGYVAVWTQGGFAITETGPDCGQSLRPQGDGRAYVVIVGDASQSTFEEFCTGLPTPRVSETALGLTVVVDAPSGQLMLSHDGPFLVDGHCPDLGEDGRLTPVMPLVSPYVTCGDGELRFACDGEEHTVSLRWPV